MANRGIAHLVEAIQCSPKGDFCEDKLGFRSSPTRFDIWVIDGATSVSDRPDRMIPGMSDPAWFARALSAEIHKATRDGPLSRHALRDMLADLRDRFLAHCGDGIEPHDIPAAAMTYLSITRQAGRMRIRGMEFADCFFAVLPPRRGGHRGRRVGMPDLVPSTRLDRSAESLRSLRKGRGELVALHRGSALSLTPASAMRGRDIRLDCPLDATLVLGSDGYPRLWTEYGIATWERALRDLQDRGCLSEVARLRRWEKTNPDHGTAPKSADDVTLAVVTLGQAPVAGLREIDRNGTLYTTTDPKLPVT